MSTLDKGTATLDNRVSALYSSSSLNQRHQPSQGPTKPTQATFAVHAVVTGAVPAGTRAQQATADVVYVLSRDFKQLQCQEGCWVLLTSKSTGRCVRAVALPAVFDSSACHHHNATSITHCSHIPCVAISPLLAHNLGIFHQLGPFSTPASQANSEQVSPGVCFELQLKLLQHLGQTGPKHQQQQQQPQTQKVLADIEAQCIARSVAICKVGQPFVSPLAGLGGTGKASTVPKADSLDQGGPAADTGQQQSSEGEGHSQSGGGELLGNASISPAGSDTLMDTLQAHFLHHPRCS